MAKSEPHIVAPVKCDLCGHEWVAMIEGIELPERLECPKCLNMAIYEIKQPK